MLSLLSLSLSVCVCVSACSASGEPFVNSWLTGHVLNFLFYRELLLYGYNSLKLGSLAGSLFIYVPYYVGDLNKGPYSRELRAHML